MQTFPPTPQAGHPFYRYIQSAGRNEILSDVTYLMITDSDDPNERAARADMAASVAGRCGYPRPQFDAWAADCRARMAADRDRFIDGAAESVQRHAARSITPGPRALDGIATAQVDWLVPQLLPRGEVSILGADGGTGKGIWQAQLIAHVTTGRPSRFFPQEGKPGNVLLFSGEDDAARVLRPRLLAAGADMTRVFAVESDQYYRATGGLLTLEHPDFARYLRDKRPALVVVDPLQSFLPAKVDMARRNQMRGAVTPLQSLCGEVGAAGLLVMHTNKKGDVAGRQRLADSSDLWDMARSVLMMGRSKADGRTYLSHEKSSYARPAQTVLFTIEDAVADGVSTAVAVFSGYTADRDADFVAAARAARPAQTREAAAAAILNTLAESRLASMESTQLKRAVMEETNCSEGTYIRTYADLIKEQKIYKQQIRQKDGRNKWFTFLYCGDLDAKVG